jgi:DNA polymerase III subunit epsilon
VPIVTLPPKYYLAHFFEFLDFVDLHYHFVFEEEQINFIAAFRNLTEEAQCVYIRMVNRKGSLFDLKNFAKYEEIIDLNSALKELAEKGFIEILSGKYHFDLLNFLTKAKLRKWLLAHNINTPVSLSRDELVEVGRTHLEKLDYLKLEGTQNIFVQGQTETMQYLLFLYFGKIQKNLTLYTLRDLGIRESQTLKNKFKSRFVSRDEAQAEYFFAKQLDQDFHTRTSEQLVDLLQEILCFKNLNGQTQYLKNELLFSFAEYSLEIHGDLALTALAESQHPNARVKMARHLYKLDRKSECLSILEDMQSDPRSDEELLFAEDFSDRKFNKKKIGRLTEVLQNSKEILVSDFYLKRPEIGVCEYYKSQGYQATFTENWFWTSLFGLLFWEELFDSENAAIHNPFERTPSNLVGPEFYLHNEIEIELKLNLLKNEEAICEKILQTVTKNFGRLNDIFQWNTELTETVLDFLKNSQKQNVAHILRAMAKKFDTHHSGFPDLMLGKQGQIHFVEVKAEGDSLRANQLARMRLLKEAGFEVEVLRVRWEADPNQIYAVVDVETTGGSSSFHRITEVGAVKIQNGKIIDEFQTLINPGRPIPAFISGITGITNEMVAEAPAFSEIAEKFLTFLEGSIFVAHNVKFDYGFIQNEFAKAGFEFVRPQLCTCAGMRKTHPGLSSYGLKNLTQHFKINLTQHHRALSDARAAAELLLLMNDQRGEFNHTQKNIKIENELI